MQNNTEFQKKDIWGRCSDWYSSFAWWNSDFALLIPLIILININLYQSGEVQICTSQKKNPSLNHISPNTHGFPSLTLHNIYFFY